MRQHICKRGKVYYFVSTVNGKRFSQSLGTSNKDEALQKSKVLYEAARGNKWELIKDIVRDRRPEVGQLPTLAELTDRYMRAAADHAMKFGKPQPLTAQNYVSALLSIAGRVHGTKDPGQLKVSVVNQDLGEKYAAMTLSLVDPGDELMMERTRTSVSSALRQAKSIFSTWAMPHYREWKMPWLQDFIRTRPCKVMRSHKYRLPPQELRDSTMKAGRLLRETNPDMYGVFVLCYDLGLRAGEAAACRWDWFRIVNNEQKHIYLDIVKRDNWRPKGHERSIPVSATVWEHLQKIRRPGDEYVLAGGFSSNRKNLVNRTFAAWMRSIGWGVRNYPKAAHELRKLIGSEWYTRFGAEVCCNWLGHADITTTYKYYADLKRHPDPIEIE